MPAVSGWTKLRSWERSEIKARAKAEPGLTQRQLAAEFKVSASTISRVVGRNKGRIGAPRRRGPCAICGTTPSQRVIHRFTLSHLPKRGLASRGAGALDLCGPCWEAHAAPRQRRRRSLRVVR